ncbi:MAG: helix-turn-helix domain-containing protein [Planctomycetota bacterium]
MGFLPDTAWIQGIGHYISAKGGAHGPGTIANDHMLAELITAGSVYDPDGRELCGPGWLFMHRPGQQTIYRSEPHGHYECLTIRITMHQAPAEPDWPRAFRWGDPESAVSFAGEMLYAYHRRGVDPVVLSQLVWSQLHFQLDQYLRREQPNRFPPRVARAIAYMESNYQQDIGVESLAEQVGLSASHLHARFREFVGMSPHKYLNQIRMRAARLRLVTSVKSISVIAVEVGFANTESFCRAFRRQFNTTAAAYRKRYTVYRGA